MDRAALALAHDAAGLLDQFEVSVVTERAGAIACPTSLPGVKHSIGAIHRPACGPGIAMVDAGSAAARVRACTPAAMRLS